VSRGFRSAAQTLASHGQAQLRHATDTDGEYHDGTRQRGGQECHGDGNFAAGGKELEANVTRVLSDEIDQRHSKEHRDGNRYPGRRGSGVAEAFFVMLRGRFVITISLNRRRGGVLAFVRSVVAVAHAARVVDEWIRSLVEVMGFEPTASTLRT
jgi:hypothetical protein